MTAIGDVLDRMKALDEDVETLAQQVDSYGRRIDAVESALKSLTAKLTGAINVDLS